MASSYPLMKKVLLLLLVTIGFCDRGFCADIPSPFPKDNEIYTHINSVNEAVQTLQTTKVMSFPTIELCSVDPAKRKTAEHLYESQMRAIDLLGKARLPGTARYLIPYLDYSTTDYHGDSFNGRLPSPEVIDQTRKYWPTFSALLDLPDSSSVLAQYALNRENPVNFRFSCFCVLRYLDKNQCIVTGNALTKEFGNSKNVPQYIYGVESDKISFEGTLFSPE